MSHKKNSLKYFMIKWDDGYSLPIFNEFVVCDSTMKGAVKQFRKKHKRKIEQKFCLCKVFSTSEIIENETLKASIDSRLYELNESLAYDELSDSEAEHIGDEVEWLNGKYDKALDVSDAIQTYLKIKKEKD